MQFTTSYARGTPSSGVRVVVAQKVGTGILAIVIQGTKIKIKIHQNFLPCLLVLFMYVPSISVHFSAILASFSSAVVHPLSVCDAKNTL